MLRWHQRKESLKGGEEVSHQIPKLTCGTQMGRVAEQEWRLEVKPLKRDLGPLCSGSVPLPDITRPPECITAVEEAQCAEGLAEQDSSISEEGAYPDLAKVREREGPWKGKVRVLRDK